jgi:tRNA pseudouridine55 synthase
LAKKNADIHGWLVVDKHHGIGSTQALAKARWIFNAEKAGHGGTLDPLATGLLPIAFGEATKTVNWAMDGRKTYQFTVAWGAETTTDDLEGEISTRSDALQHKLDQYKSNQLDFLAALQQNLEIAIPHYVGSILQQPPAFSAIKIDGARAYDLARAGERVDIAARQVAVHGLRIVGFPSATSTTFEVDCGKGTYVRSLARDLGRATGWLGHVTMLRRTKVGPFTLEHAISLEKLEQMRHSPDGENSLMRLLRPIETVLDGIPALAVMDPEAHRLKQGQRVPLNLDVLFSDATSIRDVEAVLVTHLGTPLGLFKIENRVLKAIRLFNLDARRRP